MVRCQVNNQALNSLNSVGAEAYVALPFRESNTASTPSAAEAMPPALKRFTFLAAKMSSVGASVLHLVRSLPWRQCPLPS